MSKTAHHSHDSNVLGVVHRAGGRWRVLIASVRNHRPRLLEARELAADQAGALDEALARHNTGRVIVVLPASSVICRTCTLPDVEPEQLEQALRLQAEALMLGNAPAHRLAMAVLDHAPGETNRTGIIIAWPESADVDRPDLSRPTRFAPDVAALASLLNGLRPADPLLWLDRNAGSIALGLTHANGAHFRATRQHADDWPQATARVLAETALGSGHTGPFVDALVDAHREQVAAMGPDDALLVLPAEIQRHAATRLEGAPDDADWWRRFGVSAGVLLAATSALAPLTTLQDAPQIKRPSRLSALAAALSRPNTALLVALIGLIIIGLAPLAGAGVRLGLLNLRHPDIESEMRAVEHARDRLAMYDALKKQSWSMAKLLADIVSCAPQGIELEWVRITHSDQSFTISGQAIPHGGLSATELINRMQEQLNDSQLFGEVDVNWDVKGEAFGFYEFDLTAKVERPHRPQRIEPGGELDWANWPLVDRKAGKGPTLAVEDEPEDVDIPTTEPTPPEDTMAMDVPRDEAEPEPAPEQDGQDPPGEPRRRSHLDRGPWSGESREGVASRDDVEDREGGKIDPATVPEPLTQAQVDRMTREEAQQHLTEISKARDRAQRAGDKELDTRLSDDFKLVLNRLKELKQQ